MENATPAKNMKAAKVIRVLTVAPFMALALLSSVFAKAPEEFGRVSAYVLSVIFLTVLPVLAYPMQKILPYFKAKGREGQRNLAIIGAVVGYMAGIIYAAVSNASKTVWVIFLTYLISGLGIVLFNKIVPVRASGHACGVAGPAAMGVYYLGPAALIIGVLLMALVVWSSVKMKRHTVPQLIFGALIPLLSFGAALLIVRL